MIGADVVVVESTTVEEYITEICTSVGISNGKVGPSVEISIKHGYVNLEGYLLGYFIVTGSLTEGVSFD